MNRAFTLPTLASASHTLRHPPCLRRPPHPGLCLALPSLSCTRLLLAPPRLPPPSPTSPFALQRTPRDAPPLPPHAALKLWVLPTFAKRGIIGAKLGHSDVVRCMARGPGNSFFSGGMDGVIMVWEF